MHIGRLLRRPATLMLEEVHKRLDKIGYSDIKPAHGAVFSYIGDGAQITSMAQMALTSKQNMSYLVDYLQKRGYVESYEHQSDGRAKMFRLTDKGKTCKQKTIEIIEAISLEWEEKLGRRKMLKLTKMLEELNQVLPGEMPF